MRRFSWTYDDEYAHEWRCFDNDQQVGLPYTISHDRPDEYVAKTNGDRRTFVYLREAQLYVEAAWTRMPVYTEGE